VADYFRHSWVKAIFLEDKDFNDFLGIIVKMIKTNYFLSESD
jgi:hypothetical protein